MPLSDLLAALDRDLEAELAELDAAGRRDEEAVFAAAEAEAAALTVAAEASAAAGAAVPAERLRAAARAEAAAERRRVEAAAVDRLLADVRARLAGLRAEHPDFAGVLAALLDEALHVLPPAVVRVDPRDAHTVAALLAARGSAGVEVAPVLHTWGGVEVDDGAGRLVRNTVEERLDSATPQLRRLVATAGTTV